MKTTVGFAEEITMVELPVPMAVLVKMPRKPEPPKPPAKPSIFDRARDPRTKLVTGGSRLVVR